jgi:hypothetical protein
MEKKMSRLPQKLPDTNTLERLIDVVGKHIDAKQHYLVGIVLWALHTHVYAQYRKSPRLSILSPVPNCGKSTVLDILDAMVWNPKKVIDPTVASTFRLANSHTLLLDEVDNMSIVKNMRSVINAGHEVGGIVPRTILGEVVSFPVYGPVALAGIGKQLPASIMSRSLVIRLHRSNKEIERFKATDYHFMLQLYLWAEKIKLNLDPKLPAQLIGRDADKWRPLIAIADSFDRGDMAREVALKFLYENDGPDIKESVLRDTRKVFESVKVDKLTVETMHLKLQEDADGELEVDYVERKITKRKIGDILAEFQIRSKLQRFDKGPPQKCWFREDFTEMWNRYA